MYGGCCHILSIHWKKNINPLTVLKDKRIHSQFKMDKTGEWIMMYLNIEAGPLGPG